MQNAELVQLSEKIARLIATSGSSTPTPAIDEKFNSIIDRLEKLETAFSLPLGRPTGAAYLHPSAERFAIDEALADDVRSNGQHEKACTFEPNGRPCDHCSMCSSRGF